jgi:hypothetical protein
VNARNNHQIFLIIPPVEGPFEYGKESLGSIKGEKYLD